MLYQNSVSYTVYKVYSAHLWYHFQLQQEMWKKRFTPVSHVSLYSVISLQTPSGPVILLFRPHCLSILQGPFCALKSVLAPVQRWSPSGRPALAPQTALLQRRARPGRTAGTSARAASECSDRCSASGQRGRVGSVLGLACERTLQTRAESRCVSRLSLVYTFSRHRATLAFTKSYTRSRSFSLEPKHSANVFKISLTCQ